MTKGNRLVSLLLIFSLALVSSACNTQFTPQPTRVVADFKDAVNLGVCRNLYNYGQSREAVAKCQAALPGFQKAGAHTLEAVDLLLLGLVYRDLLDYKQSLAYLDQALAIWDEIGWMDGKATTLLAIGMDFDDQLDYEQAVAYYQQALRFQILVNDEYGQAMTRTRIGWLVYRLRSNDEWALSYLQMALDYYRNNTTTGQGTVSGQEVENAPSISAIYRVFAAYDTNLAHLRQLFGIALFDDNVRYWQSVLGGYEFTLPSLPVGDVFVDGVSEKVEALATRALGILNSDENSDSESALAWLEKELSYYQSQPPLVEPNDFDMAYHEIEIYALNVRQMLDDPKETEQTVAALKRSQGYQDLGLTSERIIGHTAEAAGVLNLLGIIHRDLSDYEESLTCFYEALGLFQAIGDKPDEIAVVYNIGSVFYALGDYKRALANYEQVLDYYEQESESLELIRMLQGYSSQPASQLPEDTATLLNGLGMVQSRLSNHGQALDDFRQALQIYKEASDRQGEGRVLGNIGGVYYSLKDYKQSLAYFEQALEATQDGTDPRAEVLVLQNLAAVCQVLADYGQSLTYLQQALLIAQRTGDREAETGALTSTGLIFRDLGDYEQAERYLQQALATGEQVGHRQGEVDILADLASLHESQGEEAVALEYALRAITVLESIHSELKVEELQIPFASGMVNEYHQAVRLLLAEGREEEAFDYAERSRSRTLLSVLGNQRVDPEGSEDPNLVQREVQLRRDLANLEREQQLELAKPASVRDQFRLSTISADLEIHQREYEELLVNLKLTNPEYAALRGVPTSTLEQAQSLLQDKAPDVTLVSYFVTEKELDIFVIGPNDFHVERVAVTRQELLDQAQLLLLRMAAKSSTTIPQGWQRPSRVLYDWLIAPVQKYLPHADGKTAPRLGLVPNDLLHYIPFALLFNGKQALIDDYTLFYAPSVSSLQFMFGKRHPETNTVLALANPDAGGAAYLGHAATEAEAVAALFASRPLIGSESSETRFKAEAGQYDLIHIAAHSDPDPRNPLFSAILLREDESEDGRLETHEILNLDLSRTDLVVLSACETHLGELSRGDELVSLEWAFLRAGSPSLLTTFWSVDDAPTAILMQRFYTHLRAQIPKAEALRLAQIETRKDFPEPYFWAGFALTGDPGLISVTMSKP